LKFRIAVRTRTTIGESGLFTGFTFYLLTGHPHLDDKEGRETIDPQLGHTPHPSSTAFRSSLERQSNVNRNVVTAF